MKRILILSFCVAPLMAMSQSYSNIQINSTDNLSGAGNLSDPTPNPSGGSGGTQASSYSLTSGTSRILTFQSVTGDISLSYPYVRTVADGIQADGTAAFNTSMNVSAYDGISGISLDKGSGFLAGVFLDVGSLTTPPPDLAFSNSLGSSIGIDVGFTDLSPDIGQIFFIGDGLTGNGNGTVQNFHVPNAATRLFLGITDSGGYQGGPGQFQDNDGAFVATFNVVPEPTSLVILTSFALATIRSRRLSKSK